MEKSIVKAINFLLEGNRRYVTGIREGDISPKRREKVSLEGQTPVAVIVTCSDSRVPPEHIFDDGLGDLFVIRTAGNVIGEFELGSIEYGIAHLQAKLVVVLGHTHCGAIDAAMHHHGEGHIASIVLEIGKAIHDEPDHDKAMALNIRSSIRAILRSEIIANSVSEGKTEVRGAYYDIQTGSVHFLD